MFLADPYTAGDLYFRQCQLEAIFSGLRCNRRPPPRLPLPRRRRGAYDGRPDAPVRQAGHGHRHEVGGGARRPRVDSLQDRSLNDWGFPGLQLRLFALWWRIRIPR